MTQVTAVWENSCFPDKTIELYVLRSKPHSSLHVIILISHNFFLPIRLIDFHQDYLFSPRDIMTVAMTV